MSVQGEHSVSSSIHAQSVVDSTAPCSARNLTPQLEGQNHHLPLISKPLTPEISSRQITQLPHVPLPTPVQFPILNTYLQGYDRFKVKFLEEGFSFGFKLQYQGPRQYRESSNLKSANNNLAVLQQKISHEVSTGRIAGPFTSPPFDNLQISPLGLVPKKGPNEFRLIHHLSFPEGSSINDGIAPENVSVKYQTITDAIGLIKYFGKGALMAKTDIENAFRIIPIHPDDHDLLGMKIGEQFYYDKVLPMGCSISCRLFEEFSTALHWVLQHKLQAAGIAHILDDFLFVAPKKFNKMSNRSR